MSDFIQPHRNYWARPSTFDGKAPLPAGPTMKMEHLRQYAEHFHKTTGQMISDSDWLALSESAFLVWTQNHGRDPELEVPPPPAPKPQGNAAQRAVSSGLTDDIIFKKSIRRDASAFPVLKDIRYFLVWHRHFIGQIHAQDLSNVIDPTYVPKTSVEVNLFRLQNDFLYTVFQSTLLTDDTKRIVREHEASRDAQSIYKDISEFIRESPDANILVNELMAFLTTEKLDGRWRGTTKGFITHWEQKMAQYEEITPSTQHHADATKKRMLMNAVQTIPALHSIESADELRVAADPTNTVALNYKRYRALLVAAATRYDDSLLKGAKSRSGAPRTAHHMDFGWGAYNPDPIQLNMHTANYLDHGDDYHVTSHERPDEHASMQAFAARRTPSASTSNSANRPYIPPELWAYVARDPDFVAAWRDYDWNKAPANRDITKRRSQSQLRTNAHEFVPPSYDEYLEAVSAPPEDPEITRALERLAVSDTATQSHTSSGDTERGAPIPFRPSSHEPQAPSHGKSQLLSHVTNRNPVQGGNIRQLIHQAHTNAQQRSNADKSSDGKEVSEDNGGQQRKIYNVAGKRFLDISVTDVKYSISNLERATSSLMDRGANGGLLGADARVICLLEPPRTADVSGLADHSVTDLRIGTAAGVVNTHRGPACIIMHQYAIYGKGKTIHSCGQWENNGHTIDDKSRTVGGKQRIMTADGYAIPLKIRNGLPYIDMRPPTDHELETLPQIMVTADENWDPKVLDNELDIQDLDDLPEEPVLGHKNPFDAHGKYRHRSIYSLDIGDGHYVEMAFDEDFDRFVDDCVRSVNQGETHKPGKSERKPPDPQDRSHEHFDGRKRAGDVIVRGNAIDINDLRPYFLWQPHDIIRKTIENTTQYGRITPDPLPYKVRYRTPYPAANIARRSEAVSADIVYSDTPAVDGGETAAVLYFGTMSNMTTAHGIKNDDQFVNTLEDEIRARGAMDKLITDSSVIETSSRVKDILRSLVISDWQSKPYHEHQNPVERRYQTVKRHVNTVMNYTGAPAYTWLLALMYVLYVLNRTACEAIGYQVPLTVSTGQTADTSMLFQFRFWEKVYYASEKKLSYSGKPGFPSDPGEKSGRFVGFAETVGDVFTYKILTDDTKKIIYRSEVRSAEKGNDLNLRIPPAPDDGEPYTVLPSDGETEFLKSPHRFSFDDNGVYIDGNGEILSPAFKTFSPEELLHRSYLTPIDEKGQRFRARILEKVFEPDDSKGTSIQETPDNVRFLVTYDHPDRADELISYNEVLDHIEKEIEISQDPDHVVWRFTEIVAHEGPLHSTDPSYKGSRYNVKVLWSDGSTTYEPLSIIGADDPVTCALYAKKHGLLDEDGWKRFKRIAKNEKKLTRMLNQAKLRSKRVAKKYMFGYEVPKDPEDAIRIDKLNGNTRWQDAMALEFAQIMEYDTFHDYGYGDRKPPGYKRIRAHWVFAVKHDGRHKGRLVAGGHLTDAPVESVYSGVVSLRSLRIVLFVAELNKLEAWGADIGNAYLEAKTKEKVYVIGDRGFGKLHGHTLVIFKALYGLKSSGKRWHERLFDVLREQKYFVSKADSSVWMRDMGDHYEYIAVYVDDLLIASKNPKDIIDILKNTYNFKIKGDGPINYHLGCNFGRDKDGTLYSEPRQYIEKMLDSYVRMFEEQPQAHFSSPLESNDHPELDESPILNEDGRAKYLSMIGQLQWLITIGRFDLMSAVTTMARFRMEPREGHLKRLKRMYGYLRNKRFRDGAIRYRTGHIEHDLERDVVYDWQRTVYGDVHEVIPRDAPKAYGPQVVTTAYADANLYHDRLTGRALSGILHFINGTPIDWYCKRQATVETATYGSEFVVARIATEQIIDLRTTLRYLGVAIDGPAFLFGDNQSVVTSSTVPSSILNKRSSALNYHRVREAIAAGILKFLHIPGKENPADILSKHFSGQDVWNMLRPLLFWRGAPQDPKDSTS